MVPGVAGPAVEGEDERGGGGGGVGGGDVEEERSRVGARGEGVFVVGPPGTRVEGRVLLQPLVEGERG